MAGGGGLLCARYPCNERDRPIRFVPWHGTSFFSDGEPSVCVCVQECGVVLTHSDEPSVCV